jgi:hypothetical protein
MIHNIYEIEIEFYPDSLYDDLYKKSNTYIYTPLGYRKYFQTETFVMYLVLEEAHNSKLGIILEYSFIISIPLDTDDLLNQVMAYIWEISDEYNSM